MGLKTNKRNWGAPSCIPSWAFLVGEGPLQLEHVPVLAVCYQAFPAQGLFFCEVAVAWGMLDVGIREIPKDVWTCLNWPIGSMALLYMVTWIPSIYPLYVSIYTSTMDPMGEMMKCPDFLKCISQLLESSGAWFEILPTDVWSRRSTFLTSGLSPS